jgi:hypothetical protein
MDTALIKGIARSIDFFGTLTDQEAYEPDWVALGGDWTVVGEDIRRALEHEAQPSGQLRLFD